MRTLRQLSFVALAAGAALLGTTLPTLADPGLNDIPAHRHYLPTVAGNVEVGPRLCDNLDSSALQQAFNQFHVNLHRASTDSQGPVAPGLHNHIGPDIAATRGCVPIP